MLRREPILVGFVYLCGNGHRLTSGPCSISATKEGGQIKNLIAQALVERILKAARAGQKFKVHIIIVILVV
jgi:hypothetical protein